MSITSVFVRSFLSIGFVVFALVVMGKSIVSASDSRRYGNFVVKYGRYYHGGPIFSVEDMMPGQCESRDVFIKNDGRTSSRAYVSAISKTDHLSDVVDLEIVFDGSQIRNYTLNNFFFESSTSRGVLLGTLSPGESENITIKACISTNAENAYQNKKVVFDLKFDEVLDRFDLPDQCKHLRNKITRKIEGTEQRDHIKGTNENEYIIAKGGDDSIDGNGGDDCILGGDGRDHVDGGQGDDIVLGGTGDDKIDGGSGDDWISGEDGRDEIDGGRNRDICIDGERYKNCERRY